MSTTWLAALKDYGLATAIIAAVGLFFWRVWWKAIWPAFEKIIAVWIEREVRRGEVETKRADLAEQFLRERIKAGEDQTLRSESRNQKICDDFKSALDQLLASRERDREEFRRAVEFIKERND